MVHEILVSLSNHVAMTIFSTKGALEKRSGRFAALINRLFNNNRAIRLESVRYSQGNFSPVSRV